MTLKALREAAGFTQTQLARLADLDQTTVSKLERGEVRGPQYPTLMALAIALKSTPETVADAIRMSVAEAA